MYFENNLSLDGKYKGIKPNPKGYTFDNRFNIEFNKEDNRFNITDNPNFVKIYNKAISNFSCIVGRNGSGKTTFIELLISNIAWGITERQPSLMKSIYYSIDENGKYSFFLHQYINYNNEYKIYYKGIKVKYLQEGYSTNHPHYGSKYTSIISKKTKFIFHSLSPFDKIFYSISVPFSKYPKRIKPFINQMKYIGTQNIFKDDPKHEIQTITNLIKLFSNKFFNQPFKSTLGYKFKTIEIDTDYKKLHRENKDKYQALNQRINAISENIIEKVISFDNIDNYPELLAFKSMKPESQIKFFYKLLDYNTSIEFTAKEYIYSIIIDNFDFDRIEANIVNFSNLLKLLSIESAIKDDLSLDFLQLKKNILKLTKIKSYTFIKDISFLNGLLSDIDIINDILSLSSLSIIKISKQKNLSDIIHMIRKLKTREYLEFNLFLLKKKDNSEEEINYFYLSSGEKTMISYFANLSSAFTDFKALQDTSFIILIDEVELHLHPRWQLNFIEYMNTFFRPNRLNVTFQFIIATHSPFILSDIPEEQIIYINENDKTNNEFNTFGANIYDIFEKGFFLDDSIGLCSQNFIKQLSKEFHYFKALDYAIKHNDLYLLREYKKESYMNYENKEQEDLELKKNEIISLEENRTIYKYINISDSIITLSEDSDKAINIIGEPTVKEHLLSLYSNLKDISIDANS